jgi:type I restriction enzyme S subunit
MAPKGWRKVKFGDVVNRIKDQEPDRSKWNTDKYIGGQHFPEGEIRVTKYGSIEEDEWVIGSAFKVKFKPGDVLYVTRNPRLRKGGMVDFEGICSDVTYVLRADESQLLQSLLPFIIQTENFVKHTCNNAHGSTNPFLNWKDIVKYEFYLPPLEEQKKISEVLWSIEENIAKVENQFNKLQSFKWNFIFNKIFKTHDGTIKLENLTENLDNKRIPIESNKRENGKVPYYGATGIIDYVKEYIFDEKLLLVGEDGADWSSKANSSYIIEGKSWVNNHAHILRCKNIDILFLKEILNYMDLNKYVCGTTRGKLTKRDLMSINIPFLSTEKQNKITNALKRINKKLDKLSREKKSQKFLRNKLLNELLLGKLKLEDQNVQ